MKLWENLIMWQASDALCELNKAYMCKTDSNVLQFEK